MKAATLNLLLLAVLVGCVGVLAAGCATQTVEVPKEVRVPYPVPCIDQAKKPARPALRSEADLLNMPRGLRTLAVWADWLKLTIYARELEASLEGCSRLPA